VVVTDDERAALVRLTKRVRVNRAIAFRARIVLACVEDSDTSVARRLRTTKTTVAKWRSQFVERRLEGLYDEPRVGAPRTVSDEQVEAIIVKTLETTPAGETHWSTRSMAKAAGVSHTMVGRIWRTFRLQPHRSESFKISPDPQLVEKIRDVVGLYVAPPANAVVFSVDEKSQIQALQRALVVMVQAPAAQLAPLTEKQINEAIMLGKNGDVPIALDRPHARDLERRLRRDRGGADRRDRCGSRHARPSSSGRSRRLTRRGDERTAVPHRSPADSARVAIPDAETHRADASEDQGSRASDPAGPRVRRSPVWEAFFDRLPEGEFDVVVATDAARRATTSTRRRARRSADAP
jgi:transposase